MVAHPLNAIGLHAFRALLAEKITDDVRRARGAPPQSPHPADSFRVRRPDGRPISANISAGLTVHPMYAQFMRDGILCIPLNGSRHDLGDLLAADGERVDAILHMARRDIARARHTFTPMRSRTVYPELMSAAGVRLP